MFREDAEAFRATLADLCIAFNRPITDDLVRVYWESLKHLHIADVRRSAESARKGLKKFPTPKDLTPERVVAPPPPKRDDGPAMSTWAMAANKILFGVAYQGHRGFRPVGDKLPVCLKAKADYVQLAERAEREGDKWEPEDFNRMCRQGFEKILGVA